MLLLLLLLLLLLCICVLCVCESSHVCVCVCVRDAPAPKKKRKLKLYYTELETRRRRFLHRATLNYTLLHGSLFALVHTQYTRMFNVRYAPVLLHRCRSRSYLIIVYVYAISKSEESTRGV